MDKFWMLSFFHIFSWPIGFKNSGCGFLHSEPPTREYPNPFHQISDCDEGPHTITLNRNKPQAFPIECEYCTSSITVTQVKAWNIEKFWLATLRREIIMRLKNIQFHAFDSPVHVPKSHPCRYAELGYLAMKQRTVSPDRPFLLLPRAMVVLNYWTTLRTTHAKVSGPRLPCDKYFRLWSCWHANISHQYNGAADTGRTKCEDVKGPSLRVQTNKKQWYERSRWIATCPFQRQALVRLMPSNDKSNSPSRQEEI